MLVSLEPADVLSTIIIRVWDPRTTAAIAEVNSYDVAEKAWNPPMPSLFQKTRGAKRSSVSRQTIRNGLTEIMERTGLTDGAGRMLAGHSNILIPDNASGYTAGNTPWCATLTDWFAEHQALTAPAAHARSRR